MLVLQCFILLILRESQHQKNFPNYCLDKINRLNRTMTYEPVSRNNDYPICHCSSRTIYLIKAIIWKIFWLSDSHDAINNIKHCRTKIVYSFSKYEFEPLVTNGRFTLRFFMLGFSWRHYIIKIKSNWWNQGAELITKIHH